MWWQRERPSRASARHVLRLAIPLIASVVVAVVGLGRVLTAVDLNAYQNYVDFGVFYRATACVLSGCDPYAIPRDSSPPNLAPPHVLLLFVPLQAGSLAAAYLAWLALSAASVGLCLWLIVRELQLGWRWSEWILAGALLGSSGLAAGSVSSGNYYPLLAIPITVAWMSWRRSQLQAAAAWLGVAAACKVLLLLPLFWFAIHREYRAAMVMTGAWVLVFLGGVTVLGPEVYVGWLKILARAPMDGQFHDAAILQAAQRVFTDTQQYAPLVMMPAVVRPIWAVLAGLVVTLAVIARRDPDRAMLSLLAAAILVAPIGWVFGCWWMAGPALALWQRGSLVTRVMLAVAGVALWLPDTIPLWGQPAPTLTVTLGSLNSWILVALLSAGAFAPARPLQTADG